MNERTRLLAEQAFTAVGTTHDSITHRDLSVLDKNDAITVYTFTQNTMEKFAESIVRECADQITHEGPFVAEVVWGKQFHKKILEHFGVRE